MCAVASGSWGGQRPSLASYVTVTGPTDGAPAPPEGGNVGYPLSIERFESITAPGKFVSLQFWRDEECVRKWRNVQLHRQAQAKGRAGIFASYRLRVAGVIRDYTRDAREQAPKGSVAVHG